NTGTGKVALIAVLVAWVFVPFAASRYLSYRKQAARNRRIKEAEKIKTNNAKLRAASLLDTVAVVEDKPINETTCAICLQDDSIPGKWVKLKTKGPAAAASSHNWKWFSGRGKDYINILYRLGTPPVRQKVILGIIAGALVARELWKNKQDKQQQQEQEQRQLQLEPSTASLIRAPAHMSILPTWQIMAWSASRDIMVPAGSSNNTLSNTEILLPINELDQDLPNLEKVAVSAIRSSIVDDGVTDSLIEDNKISESKEEEKAAYSEVNDSTVVDSEKPVPVAAVAGLNSAAAGIGGLLDGYDIPSTLPLPKRVVSLLSDALDMVDNEINADDTDGYLKSDGWVKFGDLEEDGRFTCTIWRKALDNSPTPQWMMTGDIAVSPAQFHALNVDIDNRSTWDSTFEGAKKVDEGDDGSSTLIWKAKWPWPFSPRLYRYRQIPLVLPNNDTRAMLSLGLQGGDDKEDDDDSSSSSVRVEDYISVSCVKPNEQQEEEQSSLKSRYCLYYYEDPKVGRSMPAWLERNVAESTLPKMVSNIVSAVAKYPNDRLEKYKDVGLKKYTIKGEDTIDNTRTENKHRSAAAVAVSNGGRIRPPYATPLLYQWQPYSCSSTEEKKPATPTSLPFVFTPLDVVVRLYEMTI
ncbi:hypothetical protein FOL47_004429, partial [Perkinsus chesapeaki]